MNKELRKCQNCHQKFTIEPEDFQFYEKIQVSPPTFCPECRMIRKLSWRNEHVLYQRTCNLCENKMLSIYGPHVETNVYCNECWWSDKWDPMSFGKDYDFSKPFFQQFRELLRTAPRPNLHNRNTTNCHFCESTTDCKNCYMITGAFSENCMYDDSVFSSQNVVDSVFIWRGNYAYESGNCHDGYRLKYSWFSDNCTESDFLFDCRGCSNCFGCVGLRNKQYYIFNRPYSKRGYKETAEKWDLGDYDVVQEVFDKFARLYNTTPHRFAFLKNTNRVTGDYVEQANNCQNCFSTLAGVENSKFIFLGGLELKDSYDIYGGGLKSEMLYESAGGMGCQNVIGSIRTHNGINVKYSEATYFCQNIFGCSNIRNKKYCILNKQYTEEGYKELIPKIVQHMNDMPYMDKKGMVYKYGEFFPSELSPFAYNETIAQEYFPLTKEEALAQGYRWRDPETRNYQIDLTTEDLPNHIKDVKDDIVGKIIECAHALPRESASGPRSSSPDCNGQCTTAFKIIPQELQFYRQMNLPLPRLCPNCRHYQRLKQRNPLKLWHRQCQCQGKQGINSNNSNIYTNTIKHQHGDQPCPNEFQTSYAPERPEIVYCEQCYNAEVV